jgi:hypothetical protein
MEHEVLDYKIVMDDGPDTEVLGRLGCLDIATAAYLQAISNIGCAMCGFARANRSSSGTMVSRSRSRRKTPI